LPAVHGSAVGFEHMSITAFANAFLMVRQPGTHALCADHDLILINTEAAA